MTNHTQLLEALDRRTLVFFLGADLPRAVTGLPSRADLAHGLAQRHGLDETLSLAQVAQRVSRAGNRFDFTDYLRRELDIASMPVSPFYRGLAIFAKVYSLPAIVSTAYDEFSERALRDADVPFDRIVRGSDVAFARPDRLALLKLYGDLQMPNTLVVTEDDHYGLWRDRDKENLLDEVRALLKKQTVLFVGYNLGDPDFHLLWREVLDKMGRFARTAYAVWPGLPEEEIRIWADRGIVILEEGLWEVPNVESEAVFEDRSTLPEIETPYPNEKSYLNTRKDPLLQWLADYDQIRKHGQIPRGHKIYGQGKAWAVLAGVNHYDDPYIAGLKVCVDDVTAIQQSLTKHYQAARLLTDATLDHLPTRANILGELSIVAQTADEDDLLLFYFSGHGMAQDGESYLLARDTKLAALKHTALAMKDVREIIEQSPAHAKVIVLDACHSGASIGKAEPMMTPEFIRRVFEEAEGMAVLASCKQGQQSWEWQAERRSVFTYYLLEALSGKADLDDKGFVTVSDASRHVTDGVKAWVVDHGVLQTPTLQCTVVGDIILLRYRTELGA